MSMEGTVGRTDWQLQATTGNLTQREFGFIGLVQAKAVQQVPRDALPGSTFNNVLAHSALHAEMDHEQIAELIHISKGYMSRFMNGVAQQWAKRIVAFMRATNSIAPLQWIADQVACDVVPRAAHAARIKALEVELAAARAAARAAA